MSKAEDMRNITKEVLDAPLDDDMQHIYNLAIVEIEETARKGELSVQLYLSKKEAIHVGYKLSQDGFECYLTDQGPIHISWRE